MIVPVLLFSVTFLDQWTKWQVQRNLRYGATVPVIPGLLNVRHVRNTGAAWGVLSGAQPLLIVISVLVLALLWVRGRRMFGASRRGQVTLGLLCAGIGGNLIDRLRSGFVIDFIDFYFGAWHFPSFNVADMAICTGVGLYFLTQIRPTSRPGA